MDIRFYSMDFTLRHILPDYASSKAAASTNARFDFNGDGYFELDFKDAELQSLVSTEPELLVVWGNFQGFLTGYNFTDEKSRLFGMHLNGLLAREVVDDLVASEATDVETLLYNKIAALQSAGRLSWLTPKTKKGVFNNPISFFKEGCVPANTWVQELLATDNAGYKISADFIAKSFYIEVLSRRENGLIVSESHKNAYSVGIDYNIKPFATGGFYKTDSGEWRYIQLSSTTGVKRRDTVLAANNETDARRELEAARVASTISALTQRIFFGTDYQLGDIVRLQTKHGFAHKAVKSVLVSSEGTSYIENPEFEEVT